MSSVRESRRSAILDAALREFSAKGLDAASMSEIAKRANIGKSTIYEYFPSKDQLLEEVCRKLLRHFEERLAEAFSQEQTFRGKLRRYYALISGVVGELGINFPMLFVNGPMKHLLCSYVESFQRVLFDRLHTAFLDGQARGELDGRLNGEVASMLLVTQITPILLHGLKEFDTDSAIEQIVTILMYGIAAPAGAEGAALEKRREES